MQQPITMDEAATLLGVKVIEIFLLQKQLALLSQQVQILAEKKDEAKEDAVDESGDQE